ncbi:MAG: D-alanine--D-alanine ligase, partial [Propionicimonas sp.]|nr:D-alanine--D-alanine ligase [Propionicimonas sp.]
MTVTDRRPTVALIFGGVSSEHEISCLTAGGVLRVIDPEHYRVVPVGITRSGAWVRVPQETVAGYQVVDGQLPEVADGPAAVLLRGPAGAEVATLAGERLEDVAGVDLAFALLHGPFGEDGTIQGMFELIGLPYVGNGVLASAVGMDKHFTKTVLQAAGIEVAPWVSVTRRRLAEDGDRWRRRIEALGLPVFVKPARAGSSVGVTKVADWVELDAALDIA